MGINSMVNNFLAALTGRDSVPTASTLITYISIAQGSLGLMDASSRAVPDMIITMSAAICYAECGFTFSKSEMPHRLPPSLCNLFNDHVNNSSSFLRQFYQLFGSMACDGFPARCMDPYDFFLRCGSLKSARDCLKKVTSQHRRLMLD